MAGVSGSANVNRMIGNMPDAVDVSYGGVDGYGHEEPVPARFQDESGVIAADHSVVVADDYFPGIGLAAGEGEASGSGVDVQVGDFVWNVRGIEPAEDPGEIRLMLSNRRSNTDE